MVNECTTDSVQRTNLRNKHVVTKWSIWHNRLGHSSNDVMKCIRNKTHKFDSGAYDVCVKAKQSRLMFSMSETICCKPFELINLDL